MTVVRTVSQARQVDGTVRDNYHTHRKFAEILGLVPTAAVSEADIDLIPIWLGSKYDRGMVGHALDKGALRRFLASESPNDWNKACGILRHCTAIVWIDEKALGEDHKRPKTVVEDHWLKKLIEHHASALGNRIGEKSAAVFVERLRETFDEGGRSRTRAELLRLSAARNAGRAEVLLVAAATAPYSRGSVSAFSGDSYSPSRDCRLVNLR